ncbi:ABC transporter permease [Marisediminicola antarctica]|uniref:ABC transporter n=1 Tax=Marisediminicola antarctica TaxID=674079 RepID=A0A7L5AHX9_9MICO|nr:ABC transporter permease subunit [Marisediminicola antarctica]QHO68701.1 ABC transporter [Marisediminicola antarctica]
MSLAPLRGRTAAAGRPGLRGTLLILPAVVPALFVLGGGIGAAVAQSLGLLPLIGPVRLSLDAYTAQSGALPVSIAVSLGIATASTAIAAVVGFAAALVIVSGRWGGRIVAAISAATVTMPHLIGAAAIGLLLADSGLLPRLLGIDADAWPRLVGGPWWVAVVAEYAWKESAFVALVVAGTLATRVASFDETAALLGAGRLARLRFVMIPLCLPALVVSSTIVFVYTLGSYEVAWLLGRSYPEPLPVMALRLFGSITLTARPEAAAVAVVTTAISLAVVALAFLALRRTALWR